METQINIRMDEELKEKIEKAADLLNISVSALIRLTVQEVADRIIDLKDRHNAT